METEPKHILVVEDELPLRQVLADKLIEQGFEVTTAINGEEGLHLALEKHPDLILLDLVMPIMNGLTMSVRASDTSHEYYRQRKSRTSHRSFIL